MSLQVEWLSPKRRFLQYIDAATESGATPTFIQQFLHLLQLLLSHLKQTNQFPAGFQ